MVKCRVTDVLREQKGMALLFVLCLFALLTALGASMFFASASALGNAASSTEQEQVKLSASSFGDVVRRELENSSSSLKKMADRVDTGQQVNFSATLPDKMGAVKGTMRRTRKNYMAVQIAATYREQKSIVNVGFSRIENTYEVAVPGGGTKEVTEVSWKLSRYSPKI